MGGTGSVDKGGGMVASPSAMGRLYIVPTPIGNLEDITFRAVRVLKEVETILAEDTRRTRILCQHYGIATGLVSFHEHNAARMIPSLLTALQAGRRLALVSDAGTPGIRDPGTPLVREAVALGIEVEALPGASAVTTALSASGLVADRFVFEGFLPRKEQARRNRVRELSSERRTLVIFESPLRMDGTLREVAEAMGPTRPVVVARELTKHYETYHRGTAGELAAAFAARSWPGEMVLLVSGAGSEGGTTAPELEELAEALLEESLAAGEGVKEAARLAAERTGLSRTYLYDVALALRRGMTGEG